MEDLIVYKINPQINSYISEDVYQQIKRKLSNWKVVDELKLNFFLQNIDQISLEDLEKIKK